jgi:hypothetical protein
MSEWQDLELDDEDQLDAILPLGGDKPQYPFGCRICLTDAELKKMGLDTPDVGDMLHAQIMAKVTSASSHETAGSRVELQIVLMKVLGDEDDE